MILDKKIKLQDLLKPDIAVQMYTAVQTFGPMKMKHYFQSIT